jgi:hypothetical protein
VQRVASVIAMVMLTVVIVLILRRRWEKGTNEFRKETGWGKVDFFFFKQIC